MSKIGRYKILWNSFFGLRPSVLVPSRMRSRTLIWSSRSSVLWVSMCLLCIALPGPRLVVLFFVAPSSRNTVSSKAWNVFSLPFPLCFFLCICLVMDLAQHFPPPTQAPDRHTHNINIFWSGFALLLRICPNSLDYLYSSRVSPKLSAVLFASPNIMHASSILIIIQHLCLPRF